MCETHGFGERIQLSTCSWFQSSLCFRFIIRLARNIQQQQQKWFLLLVKFNLRLKSSSFILKYVLQYLIKSNAAVTQPMTSVWGRDYLFVQPIAHLGNLFENGHYFCGTEITWNTCRGMSAQWVYSVFGNIISVIDTSQWLSRVLIMCFVLNKNGLIWSILHVLIAMMRHKDASHWLSVE